MTELEKISQFATAMLNAATLDDLLWSIAQNIGETLGFDDCVIYLTSESNLVQKAAFGIKNPKERHVLNELVIPIGKGIVGAVAKSKEAEIVSNTKTDARYLWDEFSGLSELTVPIIYENNVIGIIDSESSKLDAYTDNDKNLLQVIANVAAPRIASAQYCAELQNTQQQLLETNRELEYSLIQLKENQESLIHTEKMASVGLLSAGVAHEINNPLAFSMSNMSYLIDSIEELKGQSQKLAMQLPHQQKSPFVESIEEVSDVLLETKDGLNRIKTIVQDLTCYSRKEDKVHHEFDVNESIESALNLVKGELKHHCKLSVDLAQLPDLLGNKCKIQQVLINLIMNARQAIEDGGTISVSTYTEGSYACIDISDNGSGIAQKDLANIFTPFFTTKPVGKGTGLGLFICYKIIKEEHGGDIDVESANGKTTFSVKLPLPLLASNDSKVHAFG